MAFRFNWPEFDNEFYKEAKSQLETAMNKGNKPSVIVDHITVKELHMGTKPPELEILEIGELVNDKFRGIFKLKYAGDAYIEIKTKVQANPMHAKTSELPRHSRPSVLAADQPLVVPMVLRISDLKLRGIVVLVVSKTKGVTLVFKNDPLESIRISSTFDSISILRDFLQRQIEAQLRNMLQEDLPVMIHNLSLKYIQLEEEKKRKKEQEERQLKLLQQQEERPSSICLSEPCLRRAFSVSSSSFMRVRSNTFSSHNDLGLPELDFSQTSSLYTPSLMTDDGYDTHFMDDYLSSSSTIMTPTITDFSTDNLCYYHPELNKKPTAPITVANLFTHNRQFITPQLGYTVSIPSQEDSISQLEAPCYYEETSIAEEEISEFTSFSFHTQDNNDTDYFFTEEEKTVILKPFENRMVRQLSQLTTVNYTLSPLTDTISHFTFRSLPYKKSLNNTSSFRHKKVPKRRVTRLNIVAPRF